MGIEDEFDIKEIPDEVSQKFRTVKDVVEYLESRK
jgi:acyl carrier protein